MTGIFLSHRNNNTYSNSKILLNNSKLYSIILSTILAMEGARLTLRENTPVPPIKSFCENKEFLDTFYELININSSINNNLGNSMSKL